MSDATSLAVFFFSFSLPSLVVSHNILDTTCVVVEGPRADVTEPHRWRLLLARFPLLVKVPGRNRRARQMCSPSFGWDAARPDRLAGRQQWKWAKCGTTNTPIRYTCFAFVCTLFAAFYFILVLFLPPARNMISRPRRWKREKSREPHVSVSGNSTGVCGWGSGSLDMGRENITRQRFFGHAKKERGIDGVGLIPRGKIDLRERGILQI